MGMQAANERTDERQSEWEAQLTCAGMRRPFVCWAVSFRALSYSCFSRPDTNTTTWQPVREAEASS